MEGLRMHNRVNGNNDGFHFVSSEYVHVSNCDVQAQDDFRTLISRSDLTYTKPVPRSEEGIPVGNGRIGSLMWTTPDPLRFQINRADVYADNCATNSFFERHNDYCGGCSYLDIEFGGQPFPESGLRQHLSVYDGALAVEGNHIFDSSPKIAYLYWRR